MTPATGAGANQMMDDYNTVRRRRNKGIILAVMFFDFDGFADYRGLLWLGHRHGCVPIQSFTTPAFSGRINGY